ncbi:MAG TPA: archease [Solirubrobacteraceae bacterium]
MYRWVEHTAELELAIEASNEREVLEEALVALAELLAARADGAPSSRRVVVTAFDRPALLAGWLEELVFLAESEGFVPTAVDSIELRDDGLEATVAGVIGDPPPLVKAVTYHRLAFEPALDGFVGRVVLDV